MTERIAECCLELVRFLRGRHSLFLTNTALLTVVSPRPSSYLGVGGPLFILPLFSAGGFTRIPTRAHIFTRIQKVTQNARVRETTICLQSNVQNAQRAQNVTDAPGGANTNTPGPQLGFPNTAWC